MRPFGGSVTRFAMPLRVVAQRFAYTMLVAVSIAILVASKADLVLIERFRTQVVDFAAPILSVASQPISAFNRAVDNIAELMSLHQENARLREENRRLMQWQETARLLQRDNAQLQYLLNGKRDPDASFVTGRVIADVGGPFVRTLLLNAGAGDGIEKGQSVLAADGLVGRIAAVGQSASRILLITDLNSRIPVLVEQSGYRAILTGDNTAKPRLEFLPVGAQVSPGDRLITSGHGGLFPPGRPIGIVTSTTNGLVRVQPYVDWDRLEFVSVLRFERLTLNFGADGP